MPLNFTVNVLLNHNAAKAIDSTNFLFELALGQVMKMQHIAVSTPHNQHVEVIQNTYDNIGNKVSEWQNTAQLTAHKDGVVLSFSVENNMQVFNEVSEDGRRLWLRNEVEDCFFKYLRYALHQENINYVLKNGTALPDDFEFNTILVALDEAMAKSYEKLSVSFWIDNE